MTIKIYKVVDAQGRISRVFGSRKSLETLSAEFLSDPDSYGFDPEREKLETSSTEERESFVNRWARR